MHESIEAYNQNREGSQVIRSGSSFPFGVKNFISFFALIGFVVSLYVLANLESGGMSGAVASPQLPGQSKKYYVEHERRNMAGFIKSNPDNMLEMSGQDIALLFQSPQMTWNEAPTVIWQYQTIDCVLDVYMASMGENIGEAPVIHYEARGHDGAESNIDGTRKCLNEIIKRSSDQNFKMAQAQNFTKTEAQ